MSSLELVIKRSKTDQLGAGATLEIPFGRKAATCPVRALRAWLEVAGIVDGPVFREVDRRHGNVAPARLSAQTVARVVKRRLRAAGFDPPPFSGHSLRAGFATQACRSDVPEHTIMRHTRHLSSRIFQGYVREARKWRDPVAGHVGL